jgi:hypothetical protein
MVCQSDDGLFMEYAQRVGMTFDDVVNAVRRESKIEKILGWN